MSVLVKGITKAFKPGTNIISDLTGEFRGGEISVLLGPSGCGKTTTLRCIAGLETPTDGEITIDGRVVYSSRQAVSLPPEKRDIGMVFQSYAIWPHMTVHENVMLPLRAHGVPRDRARARVDDTLKLVGLDGLGERNATQLSGGQQQRVAIARCLVHHPKVILLDEPLSNLDASLRISMRGELRDLQRRIDATMIFVTHDQEEAMSIADEIFLFHAGQIEQHDRPQNLYMKPRTRYVAEFLGKANLIPSKIRNQGDAAELVSARTGETIAKGRFDTSNWTADEGIGMVRPEAWRLDAGSSPSLSGRVGTVTFLGDRIELQVETPIGAQRVVVLSPRRIAVGDAVTLSVSAEHVHMIGGT